MSLSKSFNLEADTLILGQGDQDVNIVSKNGTDIKINGVVPSGGGGGVPAVGDIDFIGNLNCNDVAGGGTKGIITAEKKVNSGAGGIESEGLIKTTAAADINSGRDIIFDGQDIYKAYPGIVPPEPNKTYKDYKGLVAVGDNSVFTGDNVFRETIKVQLTNGAVPPTLDDKIILGKDGTINADSEIKASGLICENGSTDNNYVKARIFDFRPKGANAAPDNEVTGWNLSQKAPEDPYNPNLDNYLMLQNTQTTGSFNLVKSTFDPLNPTPFDIILDPQNGQVKTTTSFDAPQVNFRKNAVDNWSISQPAAGDPADGTLIIRSPNTLGSVNIFDSASTPWAQFSSVGTTLPRPTTINNTLNVNGNTTLGSTNSLLFGAYSFRPQQFYKDITSFSFNNAAVGATNLLFNTGNPAVQEWTNVNTGVGSQPISLILNPGAYKLTIRQLTNGALNEILGMYIMSDIVLSRPNDNAPTVELAQPTAYSYTQYNGVSGGANPGSPIITMIPGFLTWAVHCTFPNTTGNETANIRVTLTQMPFFA